MVAEVDYHGVCILKVDGADFLDPYDRTVARVPEITSVAMTSTVQLPLSDTDVASVGGVQAQPLVFVRVQADRSSAFTCRVLLS